MPSVGSISSTLDRSHHQQEQVGRNCATFPLIDPLDAFYLLNPSGDLSNTQVEFENWFRDHNLEVICWLLLWSDNKMIEGMPELKMYLSFVWCSSLHTYIQKYMHVLYASINLGSMHLYFCTRIPVFGPCNLKLWNLKGIHANLRLKLNTLHNLFLS